MLDLGRLSPAQREVALAGDGPLAVVAGPGSGKTTTLAARIAHLVLSRPGRPSSILALTFAGAAAQALRARLGDLLGPAGWETDVTTFHAFGLRVVNRWWRDLGFHPGPPAVYGPSEAMALLVEAMRSAGFTTAGESLPDAAWTLREFGTAVDGARLRGDTRSVDERVAAVSE